MYYSIVLVVLEIKLYATYTACLFFYRSYILVNAIDCIYQWQPTQSHVDQDPCGKWWYEH